MKYNLATLFLLFAFCASTQTVDIALNEDSNFEYSEIIPVKNTDKQKIYQATIEWLAINYQLANIEIDDPDAGKIICKESTLISCSGGTDCSINFTIVLDVKADKVKISIKNLFFSSFAAGTIPFEKKWIRRKTIIVKANTIVEAKIKRLRSLLKKVALGEQDDW